MKRMVVLLVCCMLFLVGCGGTGNNDNEQGKNDVIGQDSEISTEQQSDIVESESESKIETEVEFKKENSETISKNESEAEKVPNECSHNYSEATCTEPAKCKKCGETKGSSLGHDVKDADCTNESKCKRCGKKIGGANGHDYIGATCTKPATCSVCGVTKGSKAEHEYKSAVTNPTCVEQGFTTYTCKCGDNYVSDYVSAKGHTEVTDVAVEATYSSTGLTEGKHCSVCGVVLVKQEITPKRSAASNSVIECYHGGGSNGTYKTHSTSSNTLYNEWIIDSVIIEKEDTSNGKFKAMVTLNVMIVNQVEGCPNNIRGEYYLGKREDGKYVSGGAGGNFVKTDLREGEIYQITFTVYGLEEGEYKLTFMSD